MFEYFDNADIKKTKQIYKLQQERLTIPSYTHRFGCDSHRFSKNIEVFFEG